MFTDRTESGSLSPRFIAKNTSNFGTGEVVIKEYDNEGKKFKRYAIDPDAVLDAKNLDETALHLVEQTIFDLAKKELDSNVVVLVDVFERGSNISFPDTHTVCLWKQPDDKIKLLDPSNSSFTEYLAEIVEAEHMKWISAILHREKRFYDPGIRVIGREKYHARDCIDIAVKMGFIILENQHLDVKEILEKIYKLSNQSVLHSDLKNLNGTGLRELQKSDASEREEVLTLIKDNQDYLKDCGISTLDELEQLAVEKKSNNNRAGKLKSQLGITNRIPFWKLKHLEGLALALENFKIEHKETLKYFPDFEFALVKDKSIILDDFGNTEMHQAVQDNKIEKVEELLKGKTLQARRKFLFAVDMYGQTALHWAAAKGLTDIAKVLIDNMDVDGISMHAEGNNNYTALHFSVHSRSCQIAEYLVKKFTEEEACQRFVDTIDSFGQTALHWAASTAQEDVAELLIKKMSNNGIMQQDNCWQYYSALHLAVNSRNKRIVSLIYDKCPGLVEQKDKEGNTPLRLAAGFPEIEKILTPSRPELPVLFSNGGVSIYGAGTQSTTEFSPLGPRGTMPGQIIGPTGASSTTASQYYGATGATGTAGSYRRGNLGS